MPPDAPFLDLIVGDLEATGDHSPELDLTLCADIARTLARSAQTWASEARWTGLGGFDSTGGFWLSPLYGQRLAFTRAARCEGWLRPATSTCDALAVRFPLVPHDPDGGGPLSFNLDPAVGRRSIAQDVEPIGDRGIPTCTQRVHGAGDAISNPPTGCVRRPDPTAGFRFSSLEARLRALPGFGGCALRHPSTGLWKTIVQAPDPTRLDAGTRNFAPLARILGSHELPTGRLLLTSTRCAALVWRTPANGYGYLQLDELQSLPAAAALTDLLLLCTARED